MTDIMSREIRLASRPNGIPTAANFTLAETALDPLQDQEVLVRNLFMSVDPYMRGRMNDGRSYIPPFELGKPLDGGAVGEVIESRAKEFKPGDAVTSSFGWREYFIASPKELHPVSPGDNARVCLAPAAILAVPGHHAAGLCDSDADCKNLVHSQVWRMKVCRVLGSSCRM